MVLQSFEMGGVLAKVAGVYNSLFLKTLKRRKDENLESKVKTHLHHLRNPLKNGLGFL